MTHSPAMYQCLDCHTQAQGNEPEPPVWQWNQRQVPRLLCPRCGCGCAPVGWLLVAMEACHEHAARGVSIHDLSHSMWSGCPNSLECQQLGHYAGNCEQAQAVMPKCLAAVHARLTAVERQLGWSQPALPPSRPRPRRAGGQPTSGGPQS